MAGKYNKNDTLHWQRLTQQLLKEQKGKGIEQEEIESLRGVLRFHEYRYYVVNDPLLSDFEYDLLFKSLEKLEQSHPSLITPDSPTQRVAKDLTRSFPTVQHLVPMLSLDNSYNAADLHDFDRRVKELTGLSDVAYCVEPKFDGSSISLIYKNDLLIRAATRGDGLQGDDVTANVKQVRTIPLSAGFAATGIEEIEIRGEVLINKENFHRFNESLAQEGLSPLANPRNAAAGTLRLKDPAEAAKRKLEVFVYHISYTGTKPGASLPTDLQTHTNSLAYLWELGFRSPHLEKKVCHSINEVIDYCAHYESVRDELPYEIDGMVIKVNEIGLQEKMGMTSHHPRWAVAFKFKARQATTQLTGVEFQVGRTGAVTPVAKLTPVAVGGVMVSSISIHNEEYITEKDLRIGDQVLIERAGDVIPQIVKSLPDLRKGKEKKIVFPVQCPVCTSRLFKEEEEAVWRCINIECSAQVVERIIHFVSKDAMDIRGLGEANIRKFYERRLLRDIPSIYTFDFSALENKEGFGKKSIENLQTAIAGSTSQPLHRLIYALGIRFVGETTARTLAAAVDHLLDFEKFTVEQLLELEDVGPKVTGSIHDFFSNKQNIEMIKTLEKLGLSLRNEKKDTTTGGNVTGKTFLFTGTLPTLKRSAAEEMVRSEGGIVLGGVSAKLDYLVSGEDAGTKLEKAKKINTIRIISEAEFLTLLQR
ncbi:MAG: NAD-dependent DNA ligase LigA [Sphingomonadales bacterium]